ncbi:Phosphatidylinositol transfer protein SFH5 [Psilocybe cubensis]|uniref:Phosphatidylinositol transfer protein SFH5 n=2 Tax=Psilocybe cubensis TaxID=181762 RepID=A0A8H7XVG1_PSICU|nr:Phosphatidylinositol transfer protein SFH5 [Psilocybe cubensis]KAH9479469.1 Phosphatidylinositol transfer protein SFH5 [Psilocybe cubensis]
MSTDASKATPAAAGAVPEPTVAPHNQSSVAPAQVTAAPTSISEAHPSNPKAGQAATPSQTAAGTSSESDHTLAIANELQNPLTKKFTEAEWRALFEFRAQLPDIFAQAYPDNGQARELPVTIWGVTINPATPQDDARVSVVLLKFLRARNLSVTEARDMFINTLRWRESFNIEAALKEEFPEEVFGKLGYIYGKDNGGRPVAYNIYGGNSDLKAVFGDIQRFIRWRVAFMEKSVALLDFVEIDQMIQVHDYLGVSFTTRDANSKAAASEATNIFQSHYPELLYKKFFINIPTIFNWIFWLFKPLISANTLAKMSVVGTGQEAIRKALSPFIDSKELPERYGGEAKAF